MKHAAVTGKPDPEPPYPVTTCPDPFHREAETDPKRWTIYRFLDTPDGEPSKWHVSTSNGPTLPPEKMEAVPVVPASSLEAAEARLRQIREATTEFVATLSAKDQKRLADALGDRSVAAMFAALAQPTDSEATE